MKIEVADYDIDHGEQHDYAFCPIALACNRQGLSRTFVYDDVTWDASNGDRLRASLPQSALDFIRDFDGDKPVSPFSFELDVERAQKSLLPHEDALGMNKSEEDSTDV